MVLGCFSNSRNVFIIFHNRIQALLNMLCTVCTLFYFSTRQVTQIMKDKPSMLLFSNSFFNRFTKSFLPMPSKWSCSSDMVKSQSFSVEPMYRNSAAEGPEPRNPNFSATCFVIPNSDAKDLQFPMVLEFISSFGDNNLMNFVSPEMR